MSGVNQKESDHFATALQWYAAIKRAKGLTNPGLTVLFCFDSSFTTKDPLKNLPTRAQPAALHRASRKSSATATGTGSSLWSQKHV